MNNANDYYLAFLRSSITWLEKYIEIVNYYSDWKQRKQTDSSFILWVKENTPKNKILHNLGTNLMLGFEGELDEEPLEIREDLKQEFYKWLNTSQINVDNAPIELKCALFDFHEILECRFEKAQKDRESRKREYEIDSPEYLEKMEEVFSKSQQVMHSGKVHEMDASRFNGNPKIGRATFAAIANSLSANDKENFHFWPQPQSIEKKNKLGTEYETKLTSEKKQSKTQKIFLITGAIFIAILSLIGLMYYYWKKKNEKRK